MNLGSIGSVSVDVVADLKNLQASISGAVPQAAQAGQKIGQSFSQAASGGIERATASMQGFGLSAAAAGAVISAQVTLPLVALAKESLTLSANLELAGAAFTHMLGSAEAAGRFLSDLKAFALETPFDFPELVPLTQRLRAFGFAAEEVIPTLKVIGDAVGLLAGGPPLMNRIALALGQMSNSARLSAQDMRQLSEAGINAWKFLAEASGKSITEIKKISEDAGLNGQAAARIIIEGMSKEFGGGMEKLTDTLIGQWNKVKEQISFALVDIGDALAPFARQAIDLFAGEILPRVRELTNAFRQMPEGLQLTVIAVAGLAAAIGPLLLGLGGVSLAISAIVAAAPILTPIAAAIAGIAVSIAALKLAGVGQDFAVFVETLRLGFSDLRRQIAELGTAIAGLMPDWARDMATVASKLFEAAGGIQALKIAFLNMIPGVREWAALLKGGAATIEFLTGRSGARDRTVGAGSAVGGSTLGVATSLGMSATAWDAINQQFGGEEGLFSRQQQRRIEETDRLLKQLLSGIEEGGKKAAAVVSELNSAFTAIQGGDNPFLVMRDAMVRGLEDSRKAAEEMQRAIDGVGEAMATAGKQIADGVKESTAGIVDLNSAIRMLSEEAERHVPQVVRLAEEYKAFGVTAVEDMQALADQLRTAEQRAVTLDRPLREVLQITKQRLETELEIARTMAAEADASELQKERVRELGGQLENVNERLDQMKGKQRDVVDLGKEMAKTFALTWDRMAQGIAKSITGAENLGQVFTNVFRSIRDALIEMVVKAFLIDLQNAIMGNVKAVSELGRAFTSLGSMVQKLFGVGRTAADTATDAAGTGSQAANATGSIASVTGLITGVVSAFTDVLSYLQGRRMEQDIGRIEVTTRGMLNELLNRRSDAWDQHNQIMGKWDMLLSGGVFLAGEPTGGGSRRGSPTGSSESLGRAIVEAIPIGEMVAPVTVLKDGIQQFSASMERAAVSTAAASDNVSDFASSLDGITKTVTSGKKTYSELKEVLITSAKGSDEYQEALDQLKQVQNELTRTTQVNVGAVGTLKNEFVNAGSSLLGTADAAAMAGGMIQRAGIVMKETGAIIADVTQRTASAVVDAAKRAGLVALPEPLTTIAGVSGSGSTAGTTSFGGSLQYSGSGNGTIIINGGIFGPDAPRYFAEQVTDILRQDARLG